MPYQSGLDMLNFQFNNNISQQYIGVGTNFKEFLSPPIHQHSFTRRNIAYTYVGGQDPPTHPAVSTRYQAHDFNRSSFGQGYGISSVDVPLVRSRPSQPNRFNFTEISPAVYDQSIINSIHSTSPVIYSQVIPSISNLTSLVGLDWKNHEGNTAPAPSQSTMLCTPDQIDPLSLKKSSIVSSPEPHFFCEECKQSFKYEKDFSRHLQATAAHAEGPSYHCACGKEDPRKDNHKRHTKKCTKMDDNAQYKCKCDITHLDKNAHLQHIKSCGLRQAGRPRSARRSWLKPPDDLNQAK
ncbi:hypothetical protein F4806DRAFT_499562 [Annulohypoxylon nitens]|nr:hypothetical protein F4806DRAFT_499562 [Annulohypoxylon nitens]